MYQKYTSRRGQYRYERRAFPTISVAGIRRITVQSFELPETFRGRDESGLSTVGNTLDSAGIGVSGTVRAFLKITPNE